MLYFVEKATASSPSTGAAMAGRARSAAATTWTTTLPPPPSSSHEKFPHGMCTTHADVINADLLAFFKAEKAGEGRLKKETGVREAAVIGG